MTASSSSSSKSLSLPRHISQRNSSHLANIHAPPFAALRGATSRLDASDSCSRDAPGQALERNIFSDFHLLSGAQHRSGGAGLNERDTRDSVAVRKNHKADREKLRRDRLNEQILELRDALEPDRLKNDKFTILGDAIETLKDLTSEVEHLRAENGILSGESCDLIQEKKELQDEKLILKASVERLQCQLQQQMNTMLSWMTIDPAVMMSGRAFPYSVPPQHGSNDGDSQHSLSQGQVQLPFVAPGPFIPVPFLQGAPAIHTALQGYYQQGNRVSSCFPYPYNLSLVPSHVERPFAHIPPPMQPFSGFSLQIRPTSVTSPMNIHSQNAAYYQPCNFWPSQSHGPNPENLEELHAGAVRSSMHLSHPKLPDECPSHVTDHDIHEDSSQTVHTTLQLQPPSFCLNTQLQESQQNLGSLAQIEEQRLILERKTSSSHGENSSVDSRFP